MVSHAAALMLAHLAHFTVARSADAVAILAWPEHRDEWVVFHFEGLEREKKPKTVLYGRMWRFRSVGYDAMVRQLPSGEYVLVARRFS